MINLRTQKQYISFALVLLIGFNTACLAHKEDKVELGIGTTVVLTAGAVVGAAALGTALWNYFTYQTPEAIQLESEELVATMRNRYQQALNLSTNAYLDEAMLIQYAQALFDGKRCGIAGDIQAITKAITKASKARKGAEYYETEHGLKRCVEDLHALKTWLVYLQTVTVDHRYYFELFETREAIFKQHRQELSILRNSSNCSSYIQNQLHTCLYLRQLKHPYLAYAQTAHADIQNLKTAIAHAPSYYGHLKADANLMLNDLTLIYQCVITDPEYQRNVQDLERERREQERLELERTRLYMEQQRIELERRRIEEERRSREEQQRLAYERERERQHEREQYYAREQQSSKVEIVINNNNSNYSR